MFGWPCPNPWTPAPVGEMRYFCKTCEVYGLGDSCWCCSKPIEDETLIRKEVILGDQYARQP